MVTSGGSRKELAKAGAESNQYRHPPQGLVKLNFDRAGSHNLGEADIGGVFRDAE